MILHYTLNHLHLLALLHQAHSQPSMVIDLLSLMSCTISPTQTMNNDTIFAFTLPKNSTPSFWFSFYTLYITRLSCYTILWNELHNWRLKTLWVLVLSLTSCVIWNNSLNFTHSTFLVFQMALWELNKIMQTKYFTNYKKLYKYKILQIDRVYLFSMQMYFFEILLKLSYNIFHFWY